MYFWQEEIEILIVFELFVVYFLKIQFLILTVYHYYFRCHKLVVSGTDWIGINKEF